MKIKNSLLFIAIALYAIFFLSCGRKNNNFLDFEQKKKEPKFNRLSLPAVQKFTVTKKSGMLCWKKIPDAQYNIYRFIKAAFIPKNPINKVPLTTTHYIDKSNPEADTCYLVRPIFYIDGKTIIGPGSKIVCV